MSIASPEQEVVDPSVDTFLSEQMDFEIICDIQALHLANPGYPPCKGDAAKWVAWRTTGCCGQGPAFRLVCDFCKKSYQNWMARQAFISCPNCGADTGGYARFTPLRKN
jgi:hypothetical protein